MQTTEALDLARKLAPELAGVSITAGVDQLQAAGVAVHGFAAADARPAIYFQAEPTAEILIHEMSHLLPVLGIPRSERSEPTPAVQEWYLRRAITTPIMTAIAEPWTGGHDLAFIRRCCHLWHRAELLGIELRPCNIVAAYELDHGIEDYRATLGWEPVRCQRWTFDRIEELPMPDAFRELYEADQAAWRRYYQGGDNANT